MDYKQQGVQNGGGGGSISTKSKRVDKGPEGLPSSVDGENALVKLPEQTTTL